MIRARRRYVASWAEVVTPEQQTLLNVESVTLFQPVCDRIIMIVTGNW